MKEIISSIFSSEGKLSFARVCSATTLITVLGCTIYDTIVNKKLDFALAGMLLASSTGHYAISKNGEIKEVTTEVTKND